MTETASSRVLLDKTSPVGHAYIELLDDGRVKAGYYKDTAKTYQSVEEAHAHFRGAYNFSNSHSAWNICYTLEDYMTMKDEGR